MIKGGIISKKDWITALGVFVVFLLAGFIGRTDSMLIRFTRIAVMALYAIALNIQFGYGGMANLGSSLYFAIGGYGILIFIVKLDFPMWAAVVLTLIALAVLAIIFGYACLRRGMASFAFLGMGICLLASQFVAKTKWLGSTNGIWGNVCPPFLVSYLPRYIIIFIACFICGVILYLFTKSPLVAMLKGARENEERLLFLGINVKKLRLVIFVVTSFFMGIAGMLYCMLNNSATTYTMDISISLQALIMCVIGGSAIYLGPVLGSVIVTMIITYISSLSTHEISKYYLGVLGIVVLLCVYLMPKGLLDPSNKLWVLLRQKMKKAKAIETAPVSEQPECGEKEESK